MMAPDSSRNPVQWLAMSVHVFTASGAIAGLLALERAFAGDVRTMFAWLALALVIDGVDGTLARRIGVREKLPHMDGELLDAIVDYLTYVVVPLAAIWHARILPPGLALIAVAVVAGGSAIYFADKRMKTADSWFRGFPALWNVVAMYLFVFPMPPWAVFTVLIILCVAMFIPFAFVHPMRVKRLRAVTLVALAFWCAAAALLVYNNFTGPFAAKMILAVTGLYFVTLPVWRGRIWAA